MKLNGQSLRQYRNGKGNLVFVYRVSGTPEALEAYKTAQGANLRHEDDDPAKAPLFFTTVPSDVKRIDIIQTRDGGWIMDTSELDAAAALTARFGGNFGNVYAQNFLAQRNQGGGASVSNTPAPAAQPQDQTQGTLSNP